jgi:hypothetical protein
MLLTQIGHERLSLLLCKLTPESHSAGPKSRNAIVGVVLSPTRATRRLDFHQRNCVLGDRLAASLVIDGDLIGPMKFSQYFR